MVIENANKRLGQSSQFFCQQVMLLLESSQQHNAVFTGQDFWLYCSTPNVTAAMEPPLNNMVQ